MDDNDAVAIWIISIIALLIGSALFRVWLGELRSPELQAQIERLETGKASLSATIRKLLVRIGRLETENRAFNSLFGNDLQPPIPTTTSLPRTPTMTAIHDTAPIPVTTIPVPNLPSLHSHSSLEDMNMILNPIRVYTEELEKENKTLGDDNNNLLTKNQNLHTEHNAEITRRDERTDELEKEINFFKRKGETGEVSQFVFNKMVTEVEETRNINRQSASGLNTANDEIASLKGQLKEFEDSSETIVHQKNVVAERDTDRIDLNTANHEIANLKIQLKELEAPRANIVHQNSVVEAERDTAQTSLTNATHEIANLRSQLKQFEASRETIVHQSNAWKAERDTARINLTTANHEIAEHKAQLKDFEASKETITCLEADKDALTAENGNSKINLNTASHEIARLTTQLQEIDAVKEAITRLEAEKIALKAKNDSAKISLNTANEAIAKLQAKGREADGSKGDSTRLEAEKTALKAKHDSAKISLNTANDEIVRLGAKIKEAEASNETIAHLETENNTLKIELDTLRASINSSNMFETVNNRFEASLAELSALRTRHRTVTGKLETTKSHLKETQMQLDALKRKHEEALKASADEQRARKGDVMRIQEAETALMKAQDKIAEQLEVTLIAKDSSSLHLFEREEAREAKAGIEARLAEIADAESKVAAAVTAQTKAEDKMAQMAKADKMKTQVAKKVQGTLEKDKKDLASQVDGLQTSLNTAKMELDIASKGLENYKKLCLEAAQEKESRPTRGELDAQIQSSSVIQVSMTPEDDGNATPSPEDQVCEPGCGHRIRGLTTESIYEMHRHKNLCPEYQAERQKINDEAEQNPTGLTCEYCNILWAGDLKSFSENHTGGSNPCTPDAPHTWQPYAGVNERPNARCDLCKQTFEGKNAAWLKNEHWPKCAQKYQKKHGDKTRKERKLGSPVTCDNCGHVYYIGRLTSMKAFHKDHNDQSRRENPRDNRNVSETPRTAPFPCEWCPNVSPTRASHYNYPSGHKYQCPNRPGSPEGVCKYCKASFSSKDELFKEHIQADKCHKKPRKVRCASCRNEFEGQTDYWLKTMHLPTCPGRNPQSEKDRTCQNCKYIFLSKNDLFRHIGVGKSESKQDPPCRSWKIAIPPESWGARAPTENATSSASCAPLHTSNTKDNAQKPSFAQPKPTPHEMGGLMGDSRHAPSRENSQTAIDRGNSESQGPSGNTQHATYPPRGSIVSYQSGSARIIAPTSQQASWSSTGTNAQAVEQHTAQGGHTQPGTGDNAAAQPGIRDNRTKQRLGDWSEEFEDL